MRFLQIVLLFVFVVVFANGGKVTWDKDGKPRIEASTKPIKGCNQGGLDALVKENNNSDCNS